MEVVLKKVKVVNKHAKRHRGKYLIVGALVLLGVVVYKSAFAANPSAPELISVNASRKAANGPSGSGDNWGVQVSNNGRYVGFVSTASNLGGQRPGAQAVYVRDRELKTTALVSVNSAGEQENGNLLRFRMSGDGRKIAFFYHERHQHG